MKKSTHHEDKSLKTFFFYTILVVFLLIVALSIKFFFIVKTSKYDGQHHFTLVIVKNHVVEELIGFTPSNSSVSVLRVTKAVQQSNLGKLLGIVPDATIQTDSSFPEGPDVGYTMTKAIWQFNMTKTNLTIFDELRLMIFAKNTSSNNVTYKSVAFPQKEDQIDTTVASLFTDDVISQENTSIQIINATNTSGLGQRLERVLVNMGANVIAVSTSPRIAATSKIQYYGNKTYTQQKISQLLGFPQEELLKQPIANIVITLGEDQSDPKIF